MSKYDGILPKQIEALKNDPRVDEILDERLDDNGYWIYFKPGFINVDDEVHCIHEWNQKDVMNKLKAVKPCDCDQCKANFVID